MANIILKAHFDGKQILLDEPFVLQPNDKLLVKVVTEEIDQREREDWEAIAASALNRAYSTDEPEYTLNMVKEPNPKYEAR